MYVLDSSALIDIKNGYPIELPVFTPVWVKMAEMAADGTLISPREAFRELRKGSDSVSEWAAVHEHMFIESDQEQGDILSEIWTKCPELDRDLDKPGPHADPWCIALAVQIQRRNRQAVYVVAHENDKNPRKITRMCQQFLDVKCIRMVEFFRRQRW